MTTLLVEAMDQRIKRDNMSLEDLVNEMEQNIGTPAPPNSSIFATMFQNFFKKYNPLTNSPSQ